jgi:hypothetical protein
MLFILSKTAHNGVLESTQVSGPLVNRSVFPERRRSLWEKNESEYQSRKGKYSEKGGLSLLGAFQFEQLLHLVNAALDLVVKNQTDQEVFDFLWRNVQLLLK